MPTLDQFKITLSWQQIVKILSLSVVVVAGYYKMLNDIEAAARLPEAEVTREEYNMKFELTANQLQHIHEDVEKLEQEVNRLRDR
jgi:hypothetical protein